MCGAEKWQLAQSQVPLCPRKVNVPVIVRGACSSRIDWLVASESQARKRVQRKTRQADVGMSIGVRDGAETLKGDAPTAVPVRNFAARLQTMLASWTDAIKRAGTQRQKRPRGSDVVHDVKLSSGLAVIAGEWRLPKLDCRHIGAGIGVEVVRQVDTR